MNAYLLNFLDRLKAACDVQMLSEDTFQLAEKKVLIVPANSRLKNEQADIFLHEDVIRRNEQIVISRLKSIGGKNNKRIYARKTEVIELSEKEATLFLDNHHLLGFGGGFKFIGLKRKHEVVAVAVFSKPLFMRYETPPYYSVELERFCTLHETTVVGGLDKLLKAYLKENRVDDIVTYVDREWSKGRSYLKLGFEISDTTEPITFLVDKVDWKRRASQQIKQKLNESNTFFVSNKGNLKLQLKARLK